MGLIVAGLRIYWKAYLDRKRVSTHEDGYPESLIEVQDLAQNETVGLPKIEIDRVSKKLDDFEAKMVEKMRRDMKNIEEKIVDIWRKIDSS